MKITLEGAADLHYIRAYRPGEIVVNDQVYHRSLVVGGHALDPDWAPQCIDQLKIEHLEPILALQPEVVLLGTGARLIFPAPPLTARFARQGIGVEIMDTGAACRTYNVLIAEGRAVVAALIVEPSAESGESEPGLPKTR